MLGARECLREIRDPCERGDLKPGAYARLEYGELVEVSVTGLDEEFFQGRGLVSSCRLSRGWHGGGAGGLAAMEAALATRVAWKTTCTTALMSTLVVDEKGAEEGE